MTGVSSHVSLEVKGGLAAPGYLGRIDLKAVQYLRALVKSCSPTICILLNRVLGIISIRLCEFLVLFLITLNEFFLALSQLRRI